MESQYLTVIGVWAALAWADGVIVEAEAIALRRLISRAPMLTPEERSVAEGYLTQRTELPVEGLRKLDVGLRAGVYRAALQLAHIDRDFAEPERKFMVRLQESLQLDQTTVREIEAAVRAKTDEAGSGGSAT